MPRKDKAETGKPILGIDTGGSTISVALVDGGAILATRTAPQRAANEQLLTLIEGALGAAGTRLHKLAGVAVLRGPGSFTGLRIGLATAIGLHQALDLPVTAISTLEALAADGADRLGLRPGEPIVSAVDALRDEWTVQRFAARMPPKAVEDARRVPRSALENIEVPVVGFGLRDLDVSTPVEPGRLAVWAARLAALDPDAWDPALLSAPRYARPPATTSPAGDASR